MTAASSGSTTTGTPAVGPRPRLLTIAAILLGVSAVLALLFPISQLADQKFLGCSIAVGSANASPSASPSVTVTPSGGSPTVIAKATTSEQQRQQFDDCRDDKGPISPASTSGAAGTLLLQGVLPFIILGAIGFFAFRGVPLSRWFVLGAWVIGGFIGVVPLGPLQAFTVIRSGYPALPTTLIVLGSITFTAAAVIVNIPVVTRYFNSRRPVRAATGTRAGGGGLLGGLLGPRPPRGGATPPASGRTVSMDKPAPSTPASTRPTKSKGPSGGSGNTGRAKGKKRG